MKLNIGGEQKKEGWKILNIQENDYVDFVGDISDLTQFEDNTIEEIYASHILEHVIIREVPETLKGIYRILKNNGKFYVSVPDMDILCRIFMSSEAPMRAKLHAIKMMFGGQMDKFDYHYFGWNYDILEKYLREAGFKNIEKVKFFDLFDDTSTYAPYNDVPISLNVIAYK